MAYSASSAPTRITPTPSSEIDAHGPPVAPPDGVVDVDYAAHPFLDPDLFRRDRLALRYFRRLFRECMRNDWQYSRLLRRLLHPAGEESSLEVDERILASYLQDANHYVRELIDQMDPSVADRYEPLPEVWLCQDLRELGQWIFHHDHDDPERARRIRFEAQRKLYLAKLLIQIEHARVVQDGPRHRRYLIELLDREVWAYVTGVRDETARYAPDPESDLGEEDDDLRNEEWSFRVHTVRRAIPGAEIDVDVYHFDTRFKKESAGFDYAPGRGQYRVAERPRYERMKRNRSASILSKMLRKGLNDPNAITDMLGAKFIVRSEDDVHRLAELLHHALGGMFMFRNQVDLFARPQDRGRLNRFSAPDFKAFKEDVDILFAPGGEGSRPYIFTVELQILTIESFLHTVHSRAYSSHREYKRRQLMQGVMPYVFPAAVYNPS